jgi:hypothetical protein
VACRYCRLLQGWSRTRQKYRRKWLTAKHDNPRRETSAVALTPGIATISANRIDWHTRALRVCRQGA